MKDALFNSHDVALMLVIGLYFLIAVRVTLGSGLNRVALLMLPVFFLLNSFISLDTLLFWGDSIRHAAFDTSPLLPLSLSFASFAVGPVLYWHFRGQLYSDTDFRARDIAHLLPALATPVYLYWACYQYSPEQQREFILELSIFSDSGSHFLTFLTLKRLMPAIYGVFCIALVLRARQAGVKYPLLAHVSVGFTSIWLWALLVHILGQWLPITISDSLGIFGNYLGLALGVYLFFTLTEKPVFSDDDKPEEKHQPVGQSKIDDKSVTLSRRIDRVITIQKPYLNSQLTLERFAELVQASPRQVSATINCNYKQNFNEFINRLRIDEAKRLLQDSEYQDLAILEVARLAGFNSKPTFNRLFKTCVGVTPSAYRHQFSHTLSLKES